MGIFDLLQMSKWKFVLFIIFMVASIPSYFNFNCISGTCVAGSEGCACGFLALEFFICFVWAYFVACLVVEAAKWVRKKK